MTEATPVLIACGLDFEHSLEVREDTRWALKMSASHRGRP